MIKKEVVIGDCLVLDCNRNAYCKGYCEPHYRRYHKYGNPLAGKTPNYSCLAFLKNIKKTDECIEWPFYVSEDGYGQVRLNGKMMNAHRASLILNIGPPQNKKLHAAHSPVICHNRRCVNPKHLRWATASQNAKDRRKDCTQHDTSGSNHGAAKLTEADVIDIRSSSKNQRQLAKKYDVSFQTISKIINRQRWQHV